MVALFVIIAGLCTLAKFGFCRRIKVSSDLTACKNKYADRRFHEVMFLTAHNAHAMEAKMEGGAKFAANQKYSMYKQMKSYDVRGLMIDVRYEDGRMELTHGDFNAGDFKDRMEKEIIRFLDENPCEVLWFDVQMTGMGTDIPLSETRPHMQKALDALPRLKSRMFDYRNWSRHRDWPTIQEMIDADQRVVMVVDDSNIAGSYGGNAYIMRRKHVVVETDYRNEVNKGKCTERWKNNFGKRKFDKSMKQSWSRLFTMNHFRKIPLLGEIPIYKWFKGDRKNDNKWKTLTRRMELCIKKTKIRRMPNFLAVDYVADGDAPQLVKAMNRGMISFYEGKEASQDIVCALSAWRRRDVKGGNSGCDNDEAKSARLWNVPAGTTLVVYDSPNKDMQDDFASVTVLKNTGPSGRVVKRFGRSFSDAYLKVVYFRNNGLDGKISRFIIRPPGSPSPLKGGIVTLYEGDRGTQNIVCSLRTNRDYTLDLTKRRRRRRDPGCDNDEARSMKLVGVPKGTKIRVYDSGSRRRVSDDWTEITVKRNITTYTIKSFEWSFRNNDLQVSWHKTNGLNGKVSQVKIRVP